jgi:YEATS family
MPPAPAAAGTKRKAADDQSIRPADWVIPIVIGSYARKLAATELGQVYEWVVCLRAGDDPLRDLSPFIASVEFTLHPSFIVSKRLIASQPFLVKEEGWGEFPVSIKVNFAIEGVPAVVTTHHLKLISPVVDGFTVNERYDQICISVPRGWIYPNPLPRLQIHIDPIYSQFWGGFQAIAGLEELAAAELTAELNKHTSIVADLRRQARILEEEYLRLRLDHIS